MNNQMANANSQKLLDATQQAVVGAADEVETVIEKTSAELEGQEPFYLSGEFWVAMAFILVVVALFIPLKRALFSFLDKYIQKETSRIDEAAVLKDDARKVLADYERKLEDIAVETKEILDKAEKRAELTEKKELQSLNVRLMSQEKTVKDRVAAELAFAEKELTSVVIEKSVVLLEQTIESKMDRTRQNQLIDASIEKIAKL